MPKDGFEYRIDLLSGAKVSYANEQGFAMRGAKVDAYDVWNRDLTEADIVALETSLDELELEPAA